MQLSAIDRKILNCIQEDIPIDSEMFKILSDQLDIEQQELLKRIKRFKQEGIIRSFNARLNHRKLGFKSTLLGMRVATDQLDSIVKELVSYREVTHCYLREGEYNLWAVFLCLNQEELDNFVRKLTKQLGAENIQNLITKKQFKLRTRLKI